MEVTYYPAPGQRGAALAVCHVEGGPTYRFPLSAESSSIKYEPERAGLFPVYCTVCCTGVSLSEVCSTLSVF